MSKRQPYTLRSFLLLCCIWLSASAMAKFDFYGHLMDFEITSQQLVLSNKNYNQKSIEYDLKRLQSALSPSAFKDLKRTQKDFNLDDWGFILLTKKASESNHTNLNQQKLLQYILLSKIGYDVQLTFNEHGVAIFGVLSERPAQSIYMFYQSKRYTNLDFSDQKVTGDRKIFRDIKNDSLRIFQYHFEQTPNLNATLNSKLILWKYKEKIYRLNAVNNLSLTAYLTDLPVLELGKNYVQQKTSNEFEQSVILGLSQHLTGFKTHTEKVNFLLAFVQSAFQYQTDQEQFGAEKYNYPEETIASDFSDCEDRTLLLAYLYQRLLGFNSVALYFKNEKHLCLAVAIPERSNSYSFVYNDTKFVVCEPTGIGFEAGQTGIDLKRITEVIPLY